MLIQYINYIIQLKLKLNLYYRYTFQINIYLFAIYQTKYLTANPSNSIWVSIIHISLTLNHYKSLICQHIK